MSAGSTTDTSKGATAAAPRSPTAPAMRPTTPAELTAAVSSTSYMSRPTARSRPVRGSWEVSWSSPPLLMKSTLITRKATAVHMTTEVVATSKSSPHSSASGPRSRRKR